MNHDEFIQEALTALSGPGWGIVEAPHHVDSVPGLYAIHAAPEAWEELGVEKRTGIPLYVGKSEGSLVTRELEGHFAINPAKPARTGNSTVRRSFAALLQSPLRLAARPRGHSRKANFTPADFANYELDLEGDNRLTAWMHKHLRLNVWPMPAAMPLAQLGMVEVALIQPWSPPINIRDNPQKDQRLSSSRKRLADEARVWPGITRE